MHYPAPSPSLFAQLQHRFPSSTLVTELVQIQEGQYVVRALVHAGGTIVTTAMAAAPTIEQAEDRARTRVLAVLGITLEAGASPLPDIPPLRTSPSASHQSFEAENRFSLPTSPALRADLKTDVQPEEPSPLPTYKPLETFSTPSRVETLSFPEPSAEDVEDVPEFTEIYDLGDEAVPPEPPPPAPEEPEDLSSLIALTDIEMDRIGWTKQQGRDYLKRTYRKATRQKLEVDELMDFLNYLRALPSANGL